MGIDDEHVLAFMKTVDRANLDAIHVFTFDAGLDDHVGHDGLLGATKYVSRGRLSSRNTMPILLAGVFCGKARSEWLLGPGSDSRSRDHAATLESAGRAQHYSAAPACVGGGLRLYCAPLAAVERKKWAWRYSFSD
jgi:hypothetical protein